VFVLALADRAIGFFAEENGRMMAKAAAADAIGPPPATTFRANRLAASADVMPRIIVAAVFRPPLVRAAARRAIRADDVPADVARNELVAVLSAVIAKSAILCVLVQLSL